MSYQLIYVHADDLRRVVSYSEEYPESQSPAVLHESSPVRQSFDRLKAAAEVGPQEFSGVTTAPGDPAHVQQVIDHIAHLTGPQVAEIMAAINNWKLRGSL
jgi:hypothetical protein